MPNPAQATRQVYWNIGPAGNFVYLAMVLMLIAFGWGIYRHVRMWRIGQPPKENRWLPVGARLRYFAKYSLAEAKLFWDKYSGIFHFILSWGFVVLFAATVVVFLDHDLHIRIMHGEFYLWFESFTVDIFGALAMIGLILAAIKRFAQKPDRIRNPRRLHPATADGLILLWLFVIMLTGYILEGIRIEATQDPFGSYSVVGYGFGKLFGLMGTSAMLSVHRAIWWFHMVIVMGFLAYIPYSKMFHMFTAAINNYMRRLSRPEPLNEPIDIEAVETLGVKRLDQFTSKDLFDLDACTECGRCQAVCPAYNTGKPLSPAAIILDLRNYMHGQQAQALMQVKRKLVAGDEQRPEEESMAALDDAAYQLVPEVIAPEALWSCTTCRACVEVCPVGIEQFPKIIDMRRYLVMEEAEFPDTMQDALRSLEDRGTPFHSQSSRTDWCREMGIRDLSEEGGTADDVDVVYWVGCNAAFNERNQKIARAFATLMERAGVNFAILGADEACTGDPARRIGNEYLFEQMARQNIETFERYHVKKIVTSCPHCMNVFKNDYPQFGAELEVEHHTQYLQQLVEAGRLTPSEHFTADVTYHDPCYLGRYNGVFDQPRELIQVATGKPVREMPRSREFSFCCGGGGGLTWSDDNTGVRINQTRAQEAIDTGADVVAVSCPFCMSMLEDGVNARKGEKSVQVLDVAELLEQATRPDGQTAAEEPASTH